MRFVGNTGYVVTFRQIDPLYTVDLSDPAQPRVLGELKISGYSAYLHPIGDDLLLGIGQDADDGGRPLGTQISLFDVSDLRAPEAALHARRSARAGRRRSPTTTRSSSGRRRASSSSRSIRRRRASASAARAGSSSSAASRTAPAGSSGRRRSAARSSSAGSVFTVSDAGVRASDLNTLAAQGWAAFPAPAEPVAVPEG